MPAFLFRVGRWSHRRHWLVLCVWLVLLGIVGGLAGTMQQGFSDRFSIPGMPSERAADMLLENFPGTKNPAESVSVNVVFQAPEGEKLSDPKNMQAMDAAVNKIKNDVRDMGDHQRLGNPVTVNEALQKEVVRREVEQGLPKATAEADAQNIAMLSPDGRIGYTTFDYDVDLVAHVTPEDRQVVFDALQLARDKGLKAEAGGPGFGDPLEIKSTSEIVGMAAALVVLAITFGSLVAAGMPLLSAAIGVGIGSLAIVFMTAFTELNSVTPVLGLMLGLAVGIDYALFILSRYRDEHARGLSREAAAGMAVGTAGSSVVFAGVTVIVALVALAVAKIPFLTAMGLSAAFTVFIAVMVALTLLPAILGITGRFSFAGKIPGAAGNSWRMKPLSNPPRQPFKKMTLGERWVRLIHKAPALFLLLVVVALLAFSYPAKDLKLALPADDLSPTSSTQRQSADLLREGFGEGQNSLILAVISSRNVNAEAPALDGLVAAQESEDPGFDRKKAAQQASFLYAVQTYSNNPNVVHSQLVAVNDAGDAAQILIKPRYQASDQRTIDLISALQRQSEQIQVATGADIGVTGLTPIQIDVTERLRGAMPLYLSIVVGLALLLLMIVFRSLIVPLTASLGFLLSIGAAFGATVLFWQEGLWGLVETPGPIISFMPIFLIGVTFGLAMDYQVFLVSRMRERYVRSTRDEIRADGADGAGAHAVRARGVDGRPLRLNQTDDSVIYGFAAGARVITAAALIMVAVFASFIDQPLAFIKIFGFGLGVAVFVDAFLIRMTAIPAIMMLLGRATWALPRWLDKILPHLDVEGEGLERDVKAGKFGDLSEDADHRNTSAGQEASTDAPGTAARS